MLGKFSFIALAAILLSSLCALPVDAAPSRAFVSGVGKDAPTCGARSAPCRTFQYAHDLVASGGEIVTIDSADYGKFNITKAISVINEGAGVASTTGITVNAGWSDAILLRGLLIENVLGAASDGVRFNSGGGISISNCIVRKFAVNGIAITPGAAAPSDVTVDIRDTLVEKNGDAGIMFAVGAVKATIEGVTANANGDGIIFRPDRASTFMISNSSASGNVFSGFAFAGRVSGVVSNAYAANNQYGLSATEVNGYIATVYVTRSTATGNVYGITSVHGGGYSYGDNRLDGNKTGKVFGTLKPATGN